MPNEKNTDGMAVFKANFSQEKKEKKKKTETRMTATVPKQDSNT